MENRSEADGDTIPEIGRADEQGQLGEFVAIELFPGLLVDGIGHVPGGQHGQSLRPGERGAFARAEWHCRITPSVEHAKPLFRHAMQAGVAYVRMDAAGTAVDLGGTHLHQHDQALFEAAILDRLFQGPDRIHSIESALRRLEVKSLLHDSHPPPVAGGRHSMPVFDISVTAASLGLARFPKHQAGAECCHQGCPKQVERVAERHDIGLLLHNSSDGDDGLVGRGGAIADAMDQEISSQTVDAGAGALLEQRHRLNQHVRVELLAFRQKRLEHGYAGGAAEISDHVEER
jgi:hypothetical protein